MLRFTLTALLSLLLVCSNVWGENFSNQDYIYNPGTLKPVDSKLNVKVGQLAPDFKLPSIKGDNISLSSYRGKNKVVLSFVPAAWTPVCSDQWPGYNISQGLFEKHNTIIIGICVDNIPTLHAWVKQMGDLWFDVVSDFWPHGQVAETYGVLRTDGTAERALIFIDSKGIVQGAQITDINVRPPLEDVVQMLGSME